MAEQSQFRRWRWPVVAVVVVAVLWAVQHGGHQPSTTGAAPGPTSPPASASSPATPSGSAAPTGAGAATTGSAPTGSTDPYAPARFAAPVRTYAKKAGIDPQLLMAILYNEAYKPHDPSFERAWQKMKPDSAFGIANMHKAAFDDTKKGRDFADRDWQELPDHPDLAVEAAAWYLHDLAAQLPSERAGGLTEDELLALGYNTGAANMRAFARGVKPGTMAQSYLDQLHQHWSEAGTAVHQSRPDRP